MLLTWEIVAMGILAFVNVVGGFFLRRLIAQIDKMDESIQKLTVCVSKQSTRWEAHALTHKEHREDQKRVEQDMWRAINAARSER